MEKAFLPTVEKISFRFEFTGRALAYVKQISKIKDGILNGLDGNRAKLNKLQIMWDEQVQKLVMDYHKKNKKKEHSKTIELLERIPIEIRDLFL